MHFIIKVIGGPSELLILPTVYQNLQILLLLLLAVFAGVFGLVSYRQCIKNMKKTSSFVVVLLLALGGVLCGGGAYNSSGQRIFVC